jgi:hypothetical protein
VALWADLDVRSDSRVVGRERWKDREDEDLCLKI